MRERGTISSGILWAVVAFVVFVALLGGACSACFNGTNDGRSLGPVQLVSHYDGDDNGGDSRNEYGNRGDQSRCRGRECRGSFSPGPFDRSPVDIHDNQVCISPNCGGRSSDDKKGEQPASLTNPSKLPAAIAAIVKAGLDMGRLFATTTIDFVENLFVTLA